MKQYRICRMICFLAVVLLGTSVFKAPKVSARNNDLEMINAEVEYGAISFRKPTSEEQELIESGKMPAIEIEDVDEYISTLGSGTADITEDVIVKTPSIQTFGLSDVASQYIGVNPIPLPPVKINCQFTYQTKKNAKGKYYFTSVSKIKSWLSGIQVPMSYTWAQKSSSKSFSNGKQKVKITLNGVIGTHVTIGGVGKIMEQNMSYSFTFTARK